MHDNGDACHEKVLRALYLGVLGREPDPDGVNYFLGRLRADPDALDAIAGEFFTSEEHRRKLPDTLPKGLNETPRFRAPVELRVSPTHISRALVIGSCFSEGISHHISRVFADAEADYITYNYAGELPEEPPHPLSEYAFQLIVLPLRSVMPETMFSRLAWDDKAGFDAALAHSERVLVQLFDGALTYNTQHGLTTFVSNFLVTQGNTMGRLIPQNDIRNPACYVSRLNDVIAGLCADRHNVHLLDADGLACHIGKRHIQDDVLCMNSHGTFIGDFDWENDRARLHPPQPMSAVLKLAIDEFQVAVWTEAEAMLRTIRQQDSVKLVICDLDDTLWRGVIAEEGLGNPALIEGWPLGVIEALNWLKRRGVLLAIASKNDEGRIRELWPHVVGNHLSIDDFAVVKINWQPKADNIREILRDCNLLARNAVFIDDNPVERNSVSEAHPGIRVLGSDLYSIRRILLWAPETQVAAVSNESARRTEMIRAQVERERTREAMPREEFLASLGVRVTRITISDRAHPRFARAFELVNKSNQFNTTGERWTAEQVQHFFVAGGRFETFDVTDKFTRYGLVGVAIVEGSTLRQYVMSCRVLGLDAELAFLHTLVGEIADREGLVRGSVVITDANVLARDLFARLGFREAESGTWLGPASPRPAVPAHVAIEAPESVPA